MRNTSHHLKTYPQYFIAVIKETKTFEVRKNDRDYKVNDVLFLEEFEPGTQTYTGRTATALVTYILHGGIHGIDEESVVMSIKLFTMFLFYDDPKKDNTYFDNEYVAKLEIEGDTGIIENKD